MPKIINSLRERIKEEATSLFCEFGFEKVDMKTIARACNIAVGTLYNYYPNKRELYMSIVRESWSKTFKRMDSVELDKQNTEKNLRDIIKILYEDIIDRQGIGADVAAVGRNGKSAFIDIKNEFIENIFIILNKLEIADKYKDYKDIQNKIANMLLANTVVLISLDKNNKDENLTTLVDSIKVYYK